MKKLFLLFFIPFLFASNPIPELSNWRVLSVILAFISVGVIALIEMLPIDNPKLKAWANEEAGQVIATAIIIIALVPTLSFIDTALQYFGSQNYNCEGSCLESIPNQYLNTLINSAETVSSNVFSKGINAMQMASKANSYSCQVWVMPPCLQGYYNKRTNAGMMVDYERYGIEFETINSVLTSLTLQQFILNVVIKEVGPFLFLLGIVLRNFFATRKVGGLLLASSIGMMVVFPATYLIDGTSINLNVYKPIKEKRGIFSENCPEVCKYSPPFAYKGNKQYFTFNQLKEEIGDDEKAYEIYSSLKSGSSLTVNGYISCVYYSKIKNCPEECRELPFPYEKPTCTNEKGCYEIPEQCKIIRISNEKDTCLKECKINPPLKNDCFECIGLPFGYRVAYKDSNTILQTPPDTIPGEYESLWNKCTKSLDPYSSCMWIIPKNYDSCDCKEPYDPQIIKDCSKRCSSKFMQTQSYYTIGSFSYISPSGMYGRTDIQSISQLFVPAYFFPLLNVLITLAFIRGLSPFLGGSIEIFGWSKVL